MGLGKKAKDKISDKAHQKGMFPSDRVEAKAAWEASYRRGKKLGESRASYAKRTGNNPPSWWW